MSEFIENLKINAGILKLSVINKNSIYAKAEFMGYIIANTWMRSVR